MEGQRVFREEFMVLSGLEGQRTRPNNGLFKIPKQTVRVLGKMV